MDSQVVTSWTCVETCVGWPNADLQVSSQVHKSRKNKNKKKHFKADITRLALTLVGWPNGEKRARKFDLDHARWAQVIASQRKYTQGLAKRSRKYSQVDNLRPLASPFGQDVICGKHVCFPEQQQELEQWKGRLNLKSHIFCNMSRIKKYCKYFFFFSNTLARANLRALKWWIH